MNTGIFMLRILVNSTKVVYTKKSLQIKSKKNRNKT